VFEKEYIDRVKRSSQAGFAQAEPGGRGLHFRWQGPGPGGPEAPVTRSGTAPRGCQARSGCRAVYFERSRLSCPHFSCWGRASVFSSLRSAALDPDLGVPLYPDAPNMGQTAAQAGGALEERPSTRGLEPARRLAAQRISGRVALYPVCLLPARDPRSYFVGVARLSTGTDRGRYVRPRSRNGRVPSQSTVSKRHPGETGERGPARRTRCG